MFRNRWPWSAARIGVAMLAAMGAGYATTYLYKSTARASAVQARDRVTKLQLPSGEVRLLVYIAASWCAASQAPTLPESLRGAVARLRRDSTAGQLSTLGISIDWSTRLGWDYLSKFDVFDEVAIGRNWANVAAERFVWSGDARVPTVPQILLVYQSWKKDSLGLRLESQEPIVRILGPSAIQAWADSVSTFPSRGSLGTANPLVTAGMGR